MPAWCQPACCRHTSPALSPVPQHGTRPAGNRPRCDSRALHMQMFLPLPIFFPFPCAPLQSCLHPPAAGNSKPCLHLAGQAAPTARGNPQLALFLQVCLQPKKVLGQFALGWAEKERRG